MEHDVGAVAERVAAEWGRERVVDDELGTLRVGEFGDLLEVNDVVGGILDRLAVKHRNLGVLIDGGLEGLEVSEVNELDLDPEARELVAHEGVSASVDTSGRDEDVSRIQDGPHDGADGAHAGCGRDRGLGLLKERQALLEDLVRRVGQTRVYVRLARLRVARERLGARLRRFELERGRQVDGRVNRVLVLVRVVPGVDAYGSDLRLLWVNGHKGWSGVSAAPARHAVSGRTASFGSIGFRLHVAGALLATAFMGQHTCLRERRTQYGLRGPGWCRVRAAASLIAISETRHF